MSRNMLVTRWALLLFALLAASVVGQQSPATTTTTTEAPRCGKKPDPPKIEEKMDAPEHEGKSKLQKMKHMLQQDSTVWVDGAFYYGSLMAYWSIIMIGGLFGITVFICSFVMSIDKCRKKKKSTLAPCFPVFTSYYGLLYGLYILTVPIFGRPKNWWYPEAPHFSPVPPNSSKRRMFVKLIFNGICLLLCPYISILTWITVASVVGIYPVSMIVLFALLLICRMADKVDLVAENLIRDVQLEKELEMKDSGGNEGAPGGPGGSMQGPSCGKVVCNIVGNCFGIFLTAFITCLKIFFDLILLFSIAATWPALNLPRLQMNGPDFTLGTLGFPELPCLGFPSIVLYCRFPAMLYAVFILLSTLVCVCVVVSSDIMVLLYDRIDRCKQAKLDIFNKRERFAAIRHNLFIQLLTICTWLVWKVVEVIISTSSGAFLETTRIFLERAGYEKCSDTNTMMGKAIGGLVLILVVTQLLRVGNGHVQNNLVYVCAVPLADSQFSLFGRAQLRNLLGIVKLSIGSFLMPFINLGLRHGAIDKVFDEIDGDNADGHLTFQEAFKKFSGVEKADFKRRKQAAKDANNGLQVGKVYLDSLFYSMFGAGATLSATIMTIHSRWQQIRDADELKEAKQGQLEIGAVTVKEWIYFHKIAHQQRKNATWMTGFVTMFKLFFGIFDTQCMSSMRCLGRSNLWQAQIESVKLASGNYFGITLQVVPFIGIFLGKACMYLNEYPTWIVTSKETFGVRSLRWENQKEGQLRPSKRLVLLYFCSVAKVSLLFAAFFTGDVLLCFAIIFGVALIEAVINKVFKEKAGPNHNPTIMFQCEAWEDEDEVEAKRKKKEKSLKYRAVQGAKNGVANTAGAALSKVLNETANAAEDGVVAEDEVDSNADTDEGADSEASETDKSDIKSDIKAQVVVAACEEEKASVESEEEEEKVANAEPDLPGAVESDAATGVRAAAAGDAPPSQPIAGIAAGVKLAADDDDDEGA